MVHTSRELCELEVESQTPTVPMPSSGILTRASGRPPAIHTLMLRPPQGMSKFSHLKRCVNDTFFPSAWNNILPSENARKCSVVIDTTITSKTVQKRTTTHTGFALTAVKVIFLTSLVRCPVSNVARLKRNLGLLDGVLPRWRQRGVISPTCPCLPVLTPASR